MTQAWQVALTQGGTTGGLAYEADLAFFQVCVFCRAEKLKSDTLQGRDPTIQAYRRPSFVLYSSLGSTTTESNVKGCISAAITTVKPILVHSWLNLLLPVVPIAIASPFAKLNHYVVFTTNVIAVIPLSALLTYATECIANESGDTAGALLNVTFGNLVEIVLL